MALHVLAYNLSRLMNIIRSNRSWQLSGHSAIDQSNPQSRSIVSIR